jgi:hypothetical protein
MVQMINNRSLLVGTVICFKEESDVRDHSLLVIAIKENRSVAAFPNLLKQGADEQVEIYVRRSLLKGTIPAPGEEVSYVVRRGGGKTFAVSVGIGAT